MIGSRAQGVERPGKGGRGGSGDREGKRVNNPHGARGILKCPQCRKKKQKCNYQDANAPCDACARGGHACGPKTRTEKTRLQQPASSHDVGYHPYRPEITLSSSAAGIPSPPRGFPGSAAATLFPSGVDPATSGITSVTQPLLSQITAHFERLNPRRASDLQYIHGRVENYLNYQSEQTQSSQQHPQFSGSGGQPLVPPGNAPQTVPGVLSNPPHHLDPGALSPLSRRSSGDRSDLYNFGSRGTTTPQPNTTAYESSAPHTPSNSSFPSSRLISGTHTHNPSPLGLPTTPTGGPPPNPQNFAPAGTSSVSGPAPHPPYPPPPPPNQSTQAVGLGQQVYYADGRRVWTGFAAPPYNPSIDHAMDPVPSVIVGPRPGPQASPQSERRNGRPTSRDPLEEFYDLDSE